MVSKCLSWSFNVSSCSLLKFGMAVVCGCCLCSRIGASFHILWREPENMFCCPATIFFQKKWIWIFLLKGCGDLFFNFQGWVCFFSVIGKQHVNVLCFSNNINKVVIGKTKSFELVVFIVQSWISVVIIYVRWLKCLSAAPENDSELRRSCGEGLRTSGHGRAWGDRQGSEGSSRQHQYSYSRSPDEHHRSWARRLDLWSGMLSNKTLLLGHCLPFIQPKTSSVWNVGGSGRLAGRSLLSTSRSK